MAGRLDARRRHSEGSIQIYEHPYSPKDATDFRRHISTSDTHGEGNETERPVRKVKIKPFAIGKFEVTFKEYKRFAIATNRLPLPYDVDWGRGRRPVINVSWEDTQAYAKWLSQATGKRYRLPTESEWEYAARGGKGRDDLWAGTSEEEQLFEYAVYMGRSQQRTDPVGGKKPNGLGLYDMSGNVFEWVEDCAHGDYEGAPTDGSAWLDANGANCVQRVIRVGAWSNPAGWLRSSSRNWDSVDWKGTKYVGFRLAQDLP